MTSFRLATIDGSGEPLVLPSEVVTQKLAILARTGAGKTFTAKRLVEGMLGLGARVVVLDPVGVWYGLRLAPDGETESGLALPVLGGDHGDLPLEDDEGERVAEVLIEQGLAAILDLSLLSRAGMRRFATAFTERLYELQKRQRQPMHLVVEEAQLFAPQRPFADSKKLLGNMEMLVRLGRNFGIGSTLISQRPQSVNKEVLSQAEVLILHQIAGAHERKAILEWINAHGLEERKEVVADLTELGVGEAYVWSPSWLRILERVKVDEISTYDSSATPEVGALDTAVPKRLPALDVEGLERALHGDDEDAPEQDGAGEEEPDHPAETAGRLAGQVVRLEKRVAELEQELEQEKAWVLDAEPQVLQFAKRIFPGARSRAGVVRFHDVDRYVENLQWLMLRFPLEVVDRDRYEAALGRVTEMALRREGLGSVEPSSEPTYTVRWARQGALEDVLSCSELTAERVVRRLRGATKNAARDGQAGVVILSVERDGRGGDDDAT